MLNRRTSRRARRGIAIAMVAALVATACSDSDSDDAVTPATDASATTSTTSAPSTTPAPTTEAPATTSTPATTAPPPAVVPPFDGPVSFDLSVADESDPVLELGTTWDTRFTYAPWVVHHDDRFHLFYTGWGREISIGYAVSDDGRQFTRPSDEPVLDELEPVDGRVVQPEAPVVWVDDDGTWVMYVGQLVSRRVPGPAIMRATAPAPEGPWTVDPVPIYTAETGEWDDEIVPQSVVVADGVVSLFYDGRDGRSASTGVLTSTDGVTFTPHDDPATPYGADPVLAPSEVQSWDGAGAGSPMVLATDDGLEMFYVGFTGPEPGEAILRIGYAVSDDQGIAWQRYADNPVIELDNQFSQPASLGFPWMGAVQVDDTYYLYYALQAGAEGVGVITGTVDRG
ncbi:MAG: hypothetical protein AAFZ07_00275 [Actinomycetota bacterium]